MLLKDMPQIIESINLYKSVSQGTGNLMYIYLGISIAAIFLSLIMIKFPISVSKLLYAKSIHASPQLSSDLEIAKVTGIPFWVSIFCLGQYLTS